MHLNDHIRGYGCGRKKTRAIRAIITMATLTKAISTMATITMAIGIMATVGVDVVLGVDMVLGVVLDCGKLAVMTAGGDYSGTKGRENLQPYTQQYSLR